MNSAAQQIAKLADMLAYLTSEEQGEFDEILRAELPVWTPLSGPQTFAYETEADILYYGGAAGGGKSDLLLGLALTDHVNSIIYRRESTQLIGLQARLLDEILKTRKGWNGQDDIMTLPGRKIEFGSCKDAGNEIKYQGRPHDLVGFDEIPHFLESQFRFLIGWNRTTKPGQRCRVVCAGNPPTNEEGRWVVSYWGPWLEPNHPRPALPGELRWFVRFEGEDRDTEVDGSAIILRNGKPNIPRSRTFIPSFVADNPFLMDTGYEAVLQSFPEPLRSQMLMGDFRAGTEDSSWQVLPTAWVEAAMARWTPEGGQGKPMDSVGADVARGGKDKTCAVCRHGNWYSPIHTWPGKATPDGATASGLIMSVTRDHAPIHVDGIGIGGSVVDHLKSNNIHVVPIIGSEKSPELDGEYDKGTGKLTFRNMRSWMYWRFRESLDPKTGDNIALPPDSEMKSDLCAPHWKLTPTGILIESKDDSLDAKGNVIPGLCRRLGRSPDKGDTVIYASRLTPKIFVTGANFRTKVRKGSWRSI
ncbi:MAG: terminase [bacterium]